MKNIMIRSISLILSLVIFASGLPVFAEEDFELVIAEMETSEALPTPTPIPTEMPEDAFELVLAETPTPEPVMNPAPELTTESVVETEQEPAMQEDDGPALETEEGAGQPEIEETIQQPQSGEENVEQETPVPEVSIAPEATETVQPEVSASPEATQIPAETEIPETSEAPEVTASAEATLAPEATLIPEEDIVVAETVEPTAEPALIQSAQELADAFGMSVEELAAALDMSADEMCALSPEELTSIHQMLMEMMSGVALLSLEPEFEIDENNRLVAYLGEGGNVVVPDGVVAIGAGAFKNNSTITSVTLPASVVTIEAEAFAGCSALCDILIPAGVDTIPDSAFRGCGSLQFVQLPEGLNKIGDSAFEDCSMLANINMPASLKQIGDRAFYGAAAITGLSFASDLETVGENAFYGCSSLVEVELPDGLASIGAGAFGSCIALEEINIPNGTQLLPGLEADVDYYTFADCDALTAVTLPEGLEVVGSGLFAQCFALEQVNIPDTVAIIEAYAFAGCEALESMKLPQAVSEISANAFEGCSFLTLQVSKGSYAETYCLENGINYSYFDSTTPIQIVPEEDTLVIGVQEKVSVAGWKLLPEGTVDTVTYSSLSDRIATVSEDGIVTGKTIGSTVICIETAGGLIAEINVEVKKAPTSVKIEGLRTKLGMMETLQLGYSLSSGSAGQVKFSSNNDMIVDVTEDGWLLAINYGKAKITAKTYNGITKTVEVEVKSEPTSLTLSDDAYTIGVGDTRILKATLNSNSAGQITYTSSDEFVATVAQDGTITALNPGTAVITVETYNHLQQVCTVTVKPAPESIVLAAEREVIGIGEKLTLQTLVTPDDAFAGAKYKSSSTKVATVNADGVVTAKAAGKATITATTYNDLPATFVVNVKKAPSSVSLVADRKIIGIGETLQLGYKLSSGSEGAVTFKSLNEAVATVTADGMLKGEAIGTAEIEVRTYNNKYKRVKFEVKEAPAEVIPAASEVKIGAGDSWVLTHTLNEGSAGYVTYISSNPEIVAVEANSKLNAIAEGEAVIMLEAYNKVFAECKVTVVPAPDGISLSAEREVIGIGEKLQMIPTTTPAETVGTIKYKSSNTRVASVNASGVVTAHRAGKATITATTYNDLPATFVVNVKKAPSSVSLVADRKIIGIGETLQLGYKLSSGSEGAVTFKSLNEEVATVTADGMLKGETIGTAEIEVRTYNNKYKRVKFEVKEAPAEVIPAASEVKIGAGDSWVLTHTLNEGSAGYVTYTSSNPEIVAVEDNSKLNAIAEGEAVITLEAYNKVFAECKVTVVPAPDGITLSAEREVIGIGEKLQMIPTTTPAETVGTIKYKSSNTKVATVNADGVVTARVAGKTTITATTYNDLPATFVVNVKKAPSSVNLVADRKIIGVDEELQLGYTLNSGSEGAVTFKSLNEDVAMVTEDGLLKGISIGTASIEVRTFNNRYKRVNFQVMAAPSAVMPAKTDVSIAVGDVWTLGYSLNDQAAGGVEFFSSNQAIVDVDQSGKIFAIAEGTAEITIEAYNGVYGVCSVTVVPAPSAIDVSSIPTVIGLSEVVPLDARLIPGNAVGTLKYTSSNGSVLAVNASGVITGKKVGTANLTIKAFNDASATVSIRVAGAPSSVSISTERSVVGVGEELLFTATLSKGSAGNYHFESSDESVIRIDRATGEAYAVGVGEAVIQVVTYNNRKAEKKVRVVEAPSNITISPASAAIGLGDELVFSAELNAGSVGTHTFESTNPEVAVVDANTGRITTCAEGVTSIIATAYNGVSASSTLQVLPELDEIKLLQPEIDETGAYFVEMIRGEAFQITVDTGIYSSISCSYTSEKGIVNISEDGVITAVRTGEDKVTVTSYNGKTVEIVVDVLNLVEMYPEVRAIKHAMGSINGEVYSNSREAFLYNYGKGNRLFEIDLSYTSDGELVLWHSWTSNRINSSVKKGYVPSLAKFENMLVFDKYDSLTYRDLLELMDDYSDVYFVMDTKITNSTEIRKQFTKMVAIAYEMDLSHVLDRMIIMIYSKDMFKITSSIYPFTQYVLTGYKYFKEKPTTAQVKAAIEYSAANGIDMISMWDYWWKPEYLEMAHSAGLTVQLHTVNSAESAKNYVLQGVDYITTDHLSVKIIEDEIARSLMQSTEIPDEATE